MTDQLDSPALWLTRAEVAKRWRVSPLTLAQWASRSFGPRYARFGKHVRYKLTDIEEWEEQQMKGES